MVYSGFLCSKILLCQFYSLSLHAKACEAAHARPMQRHTLTLVRELQVNLLGSCLTAALSKDKSTNEDMTRTETIYNALNMRGLQEITPPCLWKLCKQTSPVSREFNRTHPAASGLRLLRQGFLVSFGGVKLKDKSTLVF